MYSVVYETCVTDKILDNEDFICLDFIDVETLSKDKNIIAFISIQTRNKMEKLGFNFVIDFDPNLYSVSFLIAFFNEFLMTDDYVLVPYGGIKNAIKNPLENFFIKPDQGSKHFPGCITNLKDIDIFDRTYKIPKDLLVGISSCAKIVSEKRTFLNIENRSIIAESLYAHKGCKKGQDFSVNNIVSKIFDVIEICMFPEIVVADFALLESGEIKLIEFNFALTSGLYNCDITKLLNFYNNLGKE